MNALSLKHDMLNLCCEYLTPEDAVQLAEALSPRETHLISRLPFWHQMIHVKSFVNAAKAQGTGVLPGDSPRGWDVLFQRREPNTFSAGMVIVPISSTRRRSVHNIFRAATFINSAWGCFCVCQALKGAVVAFRQEPRQTSMQLTKGVAAFVGLSYLVSSGVNFLVRNDGPGSYLLENPMLLNASLDLAPSEMMLWANRIAHYPEAPADDSLRQWVLSMRSRVFFNLAQQITAPREPFFFPEE